MERTVYIDNNKAQDALQNYMNIFDISNNYEEVILKDALGRITYEAITAKTCDPVYNASAMDGIMVDSEKTASASELNPILLKPNLDFEYVNTGGEITKRYNAVIMIEDCVQKENGDIEIIQAAYPWQHIRNVGESIVYGEMILPSKHKIRPVDLGALAAGGYLKVKVYKKPKVAIIPTGAELVESIEQLKPGRLMESNSYVFEGLVSEYGGIANKYKIVRDDYKELIEMLKNAVSENDIIILNAGTSAGTKDYTLKAIKELGEIFLHGLAVKPGKPTILGKINNKPVLGIPGYPVSAFLMFDMYVRPLVLQFLSRNIEATEYVEAAITRRIVSSFKNEEIIRTSLGFVGDKLVATPLERGAAAVMSLVKADGRFVIERLSEGVEIGDIVKIELLKPLEEIKKTLTIIGSHDLIIDYIADKMKISSAHVGSLGGIAALKRGEGHLAPIHLLDEETGEYNISYVQRYLKGQKISLIKGVKRIQGFLIQKGNPKNITDFDSLTEDIMFANRQRGAGTRVLLDYHLNKSKINPENIAGYEKEFGTHLAVAIAVKTGVADTGLGIASAAKAMDLDFIPVSSEDYDFVVPTEFLGDDRIKKFIDIITSEEFKTKLNELSGYSYDEIGKIIDL